MAPKCSNLVKKSGLQSNTASAARSSGVIAGYLNSVVFGTSLTVRAVKQYRGIGPISTFFFSVLSLGYRIEQLFIWKTGVCLQGKRRITPALHN